MVLNLPGTSIYDASIPWVYKVGFNDKDIDDGRPTEGSAKASYQATQRVCQMLCFLGLQDACRKRTGPSQEPGE